jgi:KaiC/GvpD/RAD55 family RecA-like ATPase
MNNKRRTLRFGIPTLDSLLGAATELAPGNPLPKPRAKSMGDDRLEESEKRSRFGFTCPDGASGSVCLIGSHGTGKSVLALHFASRYFADFFNEERSSTHVFYVSTDLSFPMAQDLWFNFALDTPDSRLVPFDDSYGTEKSRERERTGAGQVRLQRRMPYSNQEANEDLALLVADDDCVPEVSFVDLAAESAGDDWGFIHRLIAVLQEPPLGSPRHLMIVDAVEGLETLVGESDAFGEKTSRRSRIAQMLRTASKKCHLLFVVEEQEGGDRIPEEFVSDVVIRLRTVRENCFDRRTVEVQKVRGQSHIRGQHSYVIRSGVGSTTGSEPNLDDPLQQMTKISPATATPTTHKEVDAAAPAQKAELPAEMRLLSSAGHSGQPEKSIAEHNRRNYQAYFHVMRSLHYMSRTIMYEQGYHRPKYNPQVAGFGIRHLDSMLSRVKPTVGQAAGSPAEKTSKDNVGDEEGLPCSTITALMGDAGTHKSVLGKCFLYKGLAPQLEYIFAKCEREKTAYTLPPNSIAVMFTTSDLDSNSLAETFLHWAKCSHAFRNKSRVHANSIDESAMMQALINRIICRRLEVHNQTPEVLMHIVKTTVSEAQRRIGTNVKGGSDTRYRHSWPIRLVIDDFRIVRSMYPAVREDPLLLPFLAFYLRREGISTLIIDTQFARPDRDRTEAVNDELRAIADNHLHTWRIPFHVESRIAISAMPPIHSSGRSQIRELRWDQNCHPPALPEVDRSLELYTGLEQGNPEQIPLEVRLYAETEKLDQYVNEMNGLLADLFIPVARNAKEDPAKVVVGVGPHQYAYLHDLCNLQGQRVLDHVLILQVDEFWTIRGDESQQIADQDPSPHPLRDEREYLSAELDSNEPRQLFTGLQTLLQSAEHVEITSRGCRAGYFDFPDCSLEQNGGLVPGVDRVPFMWEFGFLLCRADAWKAATADTVYGRPGMTVDSVLQRLPHTRGKLETEFDDGTKKPPSVKEGMQRASWREFLGACEAVSRNLGYKNERVPAFDISTISGESFCCLLLEMWASEMLERHTSSGERAKVAQAISHKHWQTTDKTGRGMLEWLKVESNTIDLYMSWLLLVDSLPMGELAKPGTPLTFSERLASSKAVASRQWYKTACELLIQRHSQEQMIAVGLPGHFSTRGDWFLGVARGSKSALLADRVLDIFSSRRNNFTRLYTGLGLPTRKLGEDNERRAFLTALTWNDPDGAPQTVRYAELVALGGKAATDFRSGLAPSPSDAGEFYWLWRSALRGYHRQSRVFQRWNTHTVRMLNDLKAQNSSGWRGGLSVYDELLESRPATIGDMNARMEKILPKDDPPNSWTLFRQRSELLIELLEHADSQTVAEDRFAALR